MLAVLARWVSFAYQAGLAAWIVSLPGSCPTHDCGFAGMVCCRRGHRLVDAAVFEPVPFRSAIADGCTHVLVLCTRPKRERKGVLTPLEVRYPRQQ